MGRPPPGHGPLRRTQGPFDAEGPPRTSRPAPRHAAGRPLARRDATRGHAIPDRHPPPYAVGMTAPHDDLSHAQRYRARLIASKLETLRLVRALAHAGVGTGNLRPRLQQSLARLAKYDAVVTGTLAVLDPDGPQVPDPPSTVFEQLIGAGAPTRDDVLASLTRRDAEAVRLALPIVKADEADVLADVEDLRQTAPEPEARKPAASGHLPTRNGRCPCGSGEKYKKCCLAKDEAREAARPVPPPTFTRASAPALHALDHRVVARILEFARARHPGAVPAAITALDRLGKPGHADELVGPWIAYHAITDGARLLDHFLRHEADRLRPDERAWLDANARTPLSIWSIEHVVPGDSVRLRDALTGEVRTVIERKGSECMRPGDGLCGRVVDLEGVSLLVGMHARPLPPIETERVVAALRAALPGSHNRAADAPVPPEALAGEHARTVLVAWCDAIRAFDARPLPTLQNTDGELLVWTVDRYRFAEADRADLVKAITAMPNVEPAELVDGDPPARTAFRRVVAGSTTLGPEGWTSHGRIHVDAQTLAVECNSTRRADRLRAELEAACGSRLEFVRREQTSVADLMAKAPKRPSGPPRPPPPDAPERDALIRTTKERSYDRWVDEKIPALGGATPRQANADPALRSRLEAILRSIEQTESAQPAAQRFDVGRIRRALAAGPPKR